MTMTGTTERFYAWNEHLARSGESKMGPVKKDARYNDFLRSKRVVDVATGHEPNIPINDKLFPFQSAIVKWAIRRGRACIFADCGLGKTPMQLEWARHVSIKTGLPVLILAPLAVSHQTVREGEKFGISVTIAESRSDICGPGIYITNYEKLHKFDASVFGGVVLDESSILKSYSGATRNEIIEAFANTPYRLACTATPAPNDYMELGNHSEFVGAMSRTEMLAMFFVHDGGDTSKWRIKGHAEDVFWRWMCSWSVMIRKPSDIGFDDDGFVLPSLEIHEHIVSANQQQDGFLFAVEAQTLQERIAARRASVDDRARKAADMINASTDRWVVWCNLNSESALLSKMIPGSVEITGSDSDKAKTDGILGFIEGRYRVIISKPTICGYGLNMQSAHEVAFVGLSDSYEQYYQAIRRCWRFGQKSTVNAHIIISEAEGAVVANIRRKEDDAIRMADNMVKHMQNIESEEIRGISHESADYETLKDGGDNWVMYLGDCVETVWKLENNSIHFSIFSPPFASLYTYSNSERDMGNCKDYGDFMVHFRFLIKELYRVTKPGRICAFHCMNLPISKEKEGYIGIRDFRGILIKAFQDENWIYHSEVCIWKDPVTAMQRTKALGLLHKQIKKDSCMSRMGIADYVVAMRKPGENTEPVTHSNETYPVSMWQKVASPVWMDINPSNTLQKKSAREEKDERHICPLQLEVIERCINLWTNPGDVVLSPFAGIGSEGYQAIRMGRKFVGVELKRAYWNQACANLRVAEQSETDELLLFDGENSYFSDEYE